ncbi:MAG: tetratricopeptide repeat protein [Treponema sp.]|nr:tetratricopeptide repeat protein [Treponema sp.]
MPVNKNLLARAQSAVISRDFELATRFYNEMLQESPDDIELLRQLGNLHVKNNKDDQALPIFNRIVELSSNDVDALISIGGIYRRQKKFDASIAVLERALATGTNNTQVSYNLGFTFRQMKRYDDAISCFEDVVDQNPNDVLAFNHIGAIYAEREEHEEAIETYLRGLKIDPNHPILQMNLAKSYEAIGSNVKAVSAYAAALKAKPGWLECIDNYSKLLLKLNRVRDAYDLINGALRLNAEDTKMHTRMGDVYMKQSIFPDAEKEYKEALSYNDEYMPALEGLIDSQEEQGKTDEAIQTIQKIEKIDPTNPTVIQKSASVYLSANYLPAAYEKIMQLMDSSSKDVRTLSLLGQYYISNGEWEQAEETLQKIIAIEPTYSEFYRSGAKRLVQAGKLDEAEKYLKKAIAQNPHDSQALTQLGSLYEQTKEMDKAYDAFRKASAADINNNLAKTALIRVRDTNPALAVYDVPPSMEMQNAEIKDEVIAPKVSVPVSSESEMQEPQPKPIEELAPRNAELIEEVELPEEEPVITFEPDDEPFDFSDMGDAMPETVQEPQKKPSDENAITPDDGLEELRSDASTGARLFDDDSMFAAPQPAEIEEPETPEEPKSEIPEKQPEPEEETAPRFADPVDEEIEEEDEEDDDIPDALSAALDKITAQADKATLAAEDAWRAARKAADYAQAAEDALAAKAEEEPAETDEYSAETEAEESAVEEAAAEETEIEEEPAVTSENLLPQDIEAVEATEGESLVTNDDLADMSVPILDLPDETTEVTDNDLSDIEVPILTPTDPVDIPSTNSANDSDGNTAPKELTSPSILDMVKAHTELNDLKASVSLFKTLRDMTKDLPQNKQDAFKESRMSAVLDGIIAELEK